MPRPASKKKQADSLLFNKGKIESQLDFDLYLANEKQDMLKVMPAWAIDYIQEHGLTEYFMSTCRRLGKSTWAYIFALYRITRLTFVNHIVAVKYFARIKNTIFLSFQNCLAIMRDNLLLGETKEKNATNYSEMVQFNLSVKEFNYCGRLIIFTSLEKPEHALGIQAISQTESATGVATIFNLFIIDELIYQNDIKKLSPKAQLLAISSIKGSLIRGNPNPYLGLVTLYLFNPWDSDHPIYLKDIDNVIPLIADRYKQDWKRKLAETNRQELLDGSGMLTNLKVSELKVGDTTIVSKRRVLVASYKMIPENRQQDQEFVKRFHELQNTEGKTKLDAMADTANWLVEFGGIPGAYMDKGDRFYLPDYAAADVLRVDLSTPAYQLKRMFFGFDRGHVDANTLFTGIVCHDVSNDKWFISPIKTDLWYGLENEMAEIQGFHTLNMKQSIERIVEICRKQALVFLGENAFSTSLEIHCDNKAGDFIEAFNMHCRDNKQPMKMLKYDGKEWGLDRRQDTEKTALTSGTLRLLSKEYEQENKWVTINDKAEVIIDNRLFEESLRDCKASPTQDGRDELPKRNSYFIDVLNAFEIGVAKYKNILIGGAG